MHSFSRVLAAAALLTATAQVGTALADHPVVPATGSEAGIAVPHALPGEDAHHPNRPVAHLTAPTGALPETGSAAAVNVPNSVPGRTGSAGEAVPHVDVASPAGMVPLTGSEQGARR